MPITLENHDCRYLTSRSPGADDGPFMKLLSSLGITLPMPLETLVDRGHIKPVLRVELPQKYLLARRDELEAGTEWAEFLHGQAKGTRIARGDAAAPRHWWKHFLDKSNDIHTIEAMKHRRDCGPDHPEPQRINHPNGPRQISPLIDYFAYWQAYEIAEIIKTCTLTSICLIPDPRRQIDGLLRNLDSTIALKKEHLEQLSQRWQKLREVFEPISRFRTLFGISSAGGVSKDQFSRAARDLANELHLDAETLKEHVRDSLLTLVERWRNYPPIRNASPGLSYVQLLLREDIAMATQLCSELEERDLLDFEDAAWARPEDRHSRGWAPLIDALPLEQGRAREDFPRDAPAYLNRYNALFNDKPFDREELRSMLRRRWQQLFRTCLAFHRLHEHISGRCNEHERVCIVEPTAPDFLVLTALHGEKVLAELWRAENPREQDPRFGDLITWASVRACERLGIPQPEAFGRLVDDGLRKHTQLRRMHLRLQEGDPGPVYPFVDDQDVPDWNDEKARFIAGCGINFAIVRNYAAHHDVLDWQMIYTERGRVAVEAILVIVLCMLRSED